MDVALVRTTTREDREAILVEALGANAPKHFALAVRMLGRREEARDVLQEAWLRAWRHMDSVREADALEAWLRRIVVRECLRALRWRAARSWITPSRWLPEATDPAPAPDSLLGDARRVEEVRRVAAKLAPRQRLVWGLRFDEGWSVKQIAECTEMTPDTVRTHLGRALARIQAEIGREHAL